MQNLLIGPGFILFIGFGIFQLVIGYQGIEYHLGAGWAIAALACTFIFRYPAYNYRHIFWHCRCSGMALSYWSFGCRPRSSVHGSRYSLGSF